MGFTGAVGVGLAETVEECGFELVGESGVVGGDVGEFAGVGCEVVEAAVAAGGGVGGEVAVGAGAAAGAEDEFPFRGADVGFFVFEIFAEDIAAGVGE